MTEEARPVRILLAEDSEADIRLTQEALKESKIRNDLFVVRDGIEAIDFLKQTGGYKDAPVPDVVLLDLNMPRKNGKEVLEEIKEDKELKTIPVVVLTTSREEEDVLRSYELHANCYVRKPLEVEGFFKVVRSIEEFWFQIVALPTRR